MPPVSAVGQSRYGVRASVRATDMVAERCKKSVYAMMPSTLAEHFSSQQRIGIESKTRTLENSAATFYDAVGGV
jgi:hypothetical protein